MRQNTQTAAQAIIGFLQSIAQSNDMGCSACQNQFDSLIRPWALCRARDAGKNIKIRHLNYCDELRF